MKRWIPLLCLAAACQLDAAPPTNATADQSLSCTPVQTYCGTPAPKVVSWNGQLPPLGSKQAYVISPDPGSQTAWLVSIADYSAGKVQWAAKFTNADLPAVEAATGINGWIDITRPPPPPPPSGGTYWDRVVNVAAVWRQ